MLRGGSVNTFKVLSLEGIKPDTICSCFYVKGMELKPVINRIIGAICKAQKISRYKLNHEIIAQLGCERSTIEKFVYKKDYFPVYLLNILIEKLPGYKREEYCAAIQKETELFKFGKSENWAKFPKRLNHELAWLSGAIAADGWITKKEFGKERMGIVDQNKCALGMAGRYFEDVFGIETSLKKHRTQDCWILIIDCKAVTRFFVAFLGFGYGPKARTISEPVIIKKSHYRLDFAKGVMLFDGSVELDGTVSIGAQSKKLIDDLYDIFKEYGFEFSYSRPNSETFYIRSPYLSECQDSKKWISLFGIDTTKGNRLNFLINGLGRKPNSEEEVIGALERFVRKRAISKVSISDVFNFAKAKKIFTKHQMMDEFKISYSTFWKYALVLRRAKIVARDKKAGRGIASYYIFNPNINEWNAPIMVS